MISFLELALAFVFIFLVVGGTLGGVSLLGWLPNSNTSSEPSKSDAPINTTTPNTVVKAPSRLTAIPTTVYFPNPRWLERITEEAKKVHEVKDNYEASALDLARAVERSSQAMREEVMRIFPSKVALMEGFELEIPDSNS